MLPARVHREEWEIDPRLRDFGVSRAELVEVVRAVVAARADAVIDDPASAEGQFAYIFGTRHIRRVFKAHGWLRHRQDNVESVKHPDNDLKVIYQSVDLAADRLHSPQAVSGKGSGADRMISAGQGTLFPEEEMESARIQRLHDLKAGAWFFCVSVSGDDVRAELSLPSGVSNGNFDSFLERIFIVREGEWPLLDVTSGSPTDTAEFEPVISRKR